MFSDKDASSLLRQHDINPTPQRIRITALLKSKCVHMSAEDVYLAINRKGKYLVSKATVYNTLGLLSQHGVVREVIADPGKVFYDPNTEPHHHFFDVTTGELVDIDASRVRVTGLPALPPGATFEGVEIIVRLRSPKDK